MKVKDVTHEVVSDLRDLQKIGDLLFLYLIKQAHVKAGLSGFITGCPAAASEQLIGRTLSSKVFLKRVRRWIFS